jgi:sporulation protein YlmC with PRC-barrel domain
MLIPIKQFSRIHVVSSSKRPLCRIKKPIIDPENGKILAFQTTLSNTPFLSVQDIYSLNRDYLQLSPQYEFHPLEDLVRVQKVLERKIRILYKKVKTESGEILGRVTNFEIDSEALVLHSLTVQKRHFHLIKGLPRIIHQKNILEITSHYILVKDSSLKLNLLEENSQKAFSEQPAL